MNLLLKTWQRSDWLCCLGFVALSISVSTAIADEPRLSPVADGRSLPLPMARFTGKVGRTFLESDRPQYPQPIKPAKGAPNVVLIVLDDCGFGQFSPFGGGTPAPALEKLAAQGLRYNCFHTTALCSPTRAALITGRNHHACGSGQITELATGYEGYTGVIPQSTATVAEILRQHGYATAWFGKNHNTPEWETSGAGPFLHWPTGLGFDYFYGFLGGDANQWSPVLFENTSPITVPAGSNYHLTTDLTSRAIEWVRKMTSIAPDKPYFLYFCPGATHAPHHAPQAWIDRFRGQFDSGWDEYRKTTFARQQKLGIIPENAQLTPRPPELPAWDAIPKDRQRVYSRMMEVYAAYGAHADAELGRLLDNLATLPSADNTLIICLCGDNGASAEGGIDGSLNSVAFFNLAKPSFEETAKHVDELGGPQWYNHYSAGWGWAMNTPFQWTKQVASHLGGSRNPLIISWPKRIRAKGEIRSQFHHVVDLAPTILESAGIVEPSIVNGVPQRPMDGVSMVYSFDAPSAPSRHRTQYFEIFANRAMYQDGWIASCRVFDPWLLFREGFNLDDASWELYNLNDDFSQSNNIAGLYPDKLKQLQELWWAEAAKNSVLPLDWRAMGRFDPHDRPNHPTERTKVVFYPGMIRLPEGSAPVTKNRSFRITADVVLSDTQSQGMLITEGGLTGGYAFYLKDGYLKFTYNWLALQHTTITSKSIIPPGQHRLSVELDYEGWFGRGARATLYVDEVASSTVQIPKTVTERYASSEGLDVGEDGGSAVCPDYRPPFRFTGTLQQVEIQLGTLDEAHLDRQVLLEFIVEQSQSSLERSIAKLAAVDGGQKSVLQPGVERLNRALDTAHDRLWAFLEKRKGIVAQALIEHQAKMDAAQLSDERQKTILREFQNLQNRLEDKLRSSLNSRAENLKLQMKMHEDHDLEGDTHSIKTRLNELNNRRKSMEQPMGKVGTAAQ